MAHDTKIPANLPPATYAPRPPRLPRPPFWMISIGLISVVASWLPLVLAARARVIPGRQPRVSIMQDMAAQPRYSQQQSSPVFADGRADRLPVPGTVARGHLEADDHHFRGYTRLAENKVQFDDAFPADIKVTDALVQRGQLRFNIYCSVCHGYDGRGHGTVNTRALELMETQQDTKDTTWTPVFDLTSEAVRNKPVGSIYNTINVGIRSMSGYGAQIPPEDRWAIVAYVRALEIAQPAAAAPATMPASPAAGATQ